MRSLRASGLRSTASLKSHSQEKSVDHFSVRSMAEALRSRKRTSDGLALRSGWPVVDAAHTELRGGCDGPAKHDSPLQPVHSASELGRE